MTPIVRWMASGVVLALVLLTGLLGVWAPADARLTEMRFAATDRAPSGEIVFVDIDANSLAAVGAWPWPRALHGQLLDRLMQMGAYEVAFDVDFSTISNATDDAALAASLERAGGYAYLASFRQSDAQGNPVINTPIAPFAQHAASVLVNVDSLEGGVVRSVPADSEAPPAKSVARTFTPASAETGSIRIDYGIDLEQIVRIPAASILYDVVDPALVRDRQVVIGASAIELRDLFAAPRFGIIPGPMVQIAAAETLKLGRSLIDWGCWPAMGVAALVLLLHAMFAKSSLVTAVASGIAGIVAVEVLALVLLSALRTDITTMPAHLACFAVVLMRLLDERVTRHRELQAQRARVAHLANHDVRTGALSQTALVDALDRDLALGKRAWLLLLRLERWDAAGASLGYAVAEAAVCVAHDRLKAAQPMLLARVESDLFAAAWAQQPDDRHIRLLAATLDSPYEVDGHRLVLETRWGASELSAASNAGQALQQARMALAVASRQGLKGIAYEASFSGDLQHRQLIDIALRRAEANGELDIAFQPQTDMSTRQTIGYEALLRWTGSQFGPVSPALFIPMAEENGTIVQLGAWVAREACRRAVAQNWAGRLSINVSPVQFLKDDVVAMLQSVLHDTGFPAERLDVEITESLFVENGPVIIGALESLRSLGIKIAIDDFGTGYSSLSYLSSLPVDKLKIDQSFVRRLSDPRGADVVESIAALARRLGHSVVVEGVETEAEFEVLRAMGCDIAQGYLFGRPGELPLGTSAVAA